MRSDLRTLPHGFPSYIRIKGATLPYDQVVPITGDVLYEGTNMSGNIVRGLVTNPDAWRNQLLRKVS